MIILDETEIMYTDIEDDDPLFHRKDADDNEGISAVSEFLYNTYFDELAEYVSILTVETPLTAEDIITLYCIIDVLFEQGEDF